MKNVLLDFNLLINGYLNKSHKTGLYYVEYNIIKNFLKYYKEEFNFFAYCDCDKKFFNKIIEEDLIEFKDIKYYDLPLFVKILRKLRFKKKI